MSPDEPPVFSATACVVLAIIGVVMLAYGIFFPS